MNNRFKSVDKGFKCGGCESDFSILLKDSKGYHVLIHSATDDEDRISELEYNLNKCISEVDLVLSSCRSESSLRNKELRNSVLEVFDKNEVSIDDNIYLNLDDPNC